MGPGDGGAQGGIEYGYSHCTAGATLLSLCPHHLHPNPGYHVRGIFYGWSPTRSHLLPRAPSFLPAEDVNHSGRSCARPAAAPQDPPAPH